ncbi:hypothetical protein CCACVL1_10977 [Corchorus capsularis]|uniref:F-box domain-containing protein n=1 Tax=Corchorus capsularis TaxID=210143 RepID=A0A1R3INI8_COCAP|nr:hypothetical protein CCACVL1_10977 [Corchorus capsularis]
MEEEEKNRSIPSLTKTKLKQQSKGFNLMNDDLLQNILSRLPATSFASAACVSKSWNAVCTRILSRPKLSSAVSLNRSPRVALQEVLDKVLSEPIRPHFAIAYFSPGFVAEDVLQVMVEKLGSRTPILLSQVPGILGRDALTHEYKEVMWNGEERCDDNTGIVLTVGFVPGLKVEVIPLLSYKEDQFVRDIKSYTSSVSGFTSPLAILMIGDAESVDQRSIIEKLDFALSKETIIVGNESGLYLKYRSIDVSRNISSNLKCSPDAVALVFARDREKDPGIGDIEFHFALSDGVSATGPRFKAISVRPKASSTWLTARREGQQEILDGQHMLDEIGNEMENHLEYADVYIGVTKRRKCSVGSDKPKLMTSLALHGVERGDEEYLYVNGIGIRHGDCFQFYQPCPKTALSSCRKVSSALGNLKLDWDAKSSTSTRAIVTATEKKEAFGGLIISCCGRGESFFGQPNIDGAPFLENFPEVPVAGIFCGGEIGRGYTNLTMHEVQEETSVPCHLHVYSTIYLLMSYTPPTEH